MPHHRSAAIVDRHFGIYPGSAARTTGRAVSNTVVSPPLSALFLDGTLDLPKDARQTTGCGPARKYRPSWHRSLGLPLALISG